MEAAVRISRTAASWARRHGCLLPVFAFLGGCGTDERTAVETIESDSAGIHIVERPASVLRPAPLELTEVLRIGAVDDSTAELFSAIVDGLILPDGSFVIADRDSREVRQFSPEGRLVRTHGREGEGPGEYEFIFAIESCSQDGFTVFDWGWQPSTYDGAGEFVEERTLLLEDGSAPYRLTCADDGRLAAIDWGRRDGPRPMGFHVAMARLRILSPDGSEELDLGERIGSERFGATDVGPHPAGRSVLFAFHGDDLLVADGSFFGYEGWARDGALREIVRVDTPPPDLDSLMSVYEERTLARADGPEQRAQWRRAIGEMGRPERATHLSDLRVMGPWIVVRGPTVGADSRWFAFGEGGEAVGFLPLPAEATILDMTADRVLTAERGALDAPEAVVYAIRGGNGS
jgi:hypothetical protein